VLVWLPACSVVNYFRLHLSLIFFRRSFCSWRGNVYPRPSPNARRQVPECGGVESIAHAGTIRPKAIKIGNNQQPVFRSSFDVRFLHEVEAWAITTADKGSTGVAISFAWKLECVHLWAHAQCSHWHHYSLVGARSQWHFDVGHVPGRSGRDL